MKFTHTLILLFFFHCLATRCNSPDHGKPADSKIYLIGDTAYTLGRIAENEEYMLLFFDENKHLRKLLQKNISDQELLKSVASVADKKEMVRTIAGDYFHELKNLVPPLFGSSPPKKTGSVNPGIFDPVEYWASPSISFGGDSAVSRAEILRAGLEDFNLSVRKTLKEACSYQFEGEYPFPPKDAAKLSGIPLGMEDDQYNADYKYKKWEELMFQSSHPETYLEYLSELRTMLEVQEYWMLNSVLHCGLGMM